MTSGLPQGPKATNSRIGIPYRTSSDARAQYSGEAQNLIQIEAGRSVCCKEMARTSWSYRGCRLDSQHPHGDSELSVTLVSEGPMPSSGLSGHKAHLWCTIHIGKAYICIKYATNKNRGSRWET